MIGPLPAFVDRLLLLGRVRLAEANAKVETSRTLRFTASINIDTVRLTTMVKRDISAPIPYPFQQISSTPVVVIGPLLTEL